jgi:hypothetical protein
MVEEEITEGLKNLTVTGDAAASGGEGQRRGGGISSNRIQVSNTKKPLFFYVNLAKVRLPLPPTRRLLPWCSFPTFSVPDCFGWLVGLLLASARAEVYAAARRCGAIRSWNGCVPVTIPCPSSWLFIYYLSVVELI